METTMTLEDYRYDHLQTHIGNAKVGCPWCELGRQELQELRLEIITAYGQAQTNLDELDRVQLELEHTQDMLDLATRILEAKLK